MATKQSETKRDSRDWSNFDASMMKYFDKLDDKTKKEFQLIGSKCGAYDAEYIKNCNSSTEGSMYSSTGTRIQFNQHYEIQEIQKCLNAGMQLVDLDPEDYTLIMNHYNRGTP